RAPFAVLVAALRGGPGERGQRAGQPLPPAPRVGHHDGAARDAVGRPRAESGARQEPGGLREQTGVIPSVDGVITADEILASAATIAALQLPSGMIPWNPGGHFDPWNHVETAMALDVAGFHAAAAQAYRW